MPTQCPGPIFQIPATKLGLENAHPLGRVGRSAGPGGPLGRVGWAPRPGAPQEGWGAPRVGSRMG